MDAAQPAFSNVHLRADLHSRNARALLYLLYDMATHPYRSVRRPRSPGTGGVADNSDPDSGEVRIKVLAAGTGFTDTFIRRASYPDFEISSPVFEKASLIAGISHAKICMLRKPKEEDTSYKTLERAPGEAAVSAADARDHLCARRRLPNATVTAQEQFVQAFEIDLDEML